MQRSIWQSLLTALLLVSSAAGNALAQQGSVSGVVNDSANAAVTSATVELINLATSNVRNTRVDNSGKFTFTDVAPGQYRVVVKAPGYNETGRGITVEKAPLNETFELSVGNIKEVVTVTANRGLTADQDTPLNITVETSQSIDEKLPVSPGEVLKETPSLFVFNSNSPLSSPNLRGLQASRVLLVVDGERVNNSRTEIQTFGASLGSYIDTFNIENVEVVAGAGASLYGTDSLTGTVNFTTKEPARPDKGWIVGGKFQGLYSSNETGRKGNVTFNVSNTKAAFNYSGTLYRFDNYHFGDPGNGSDIGLAAIKKQQDELKYLSNSNTSRQDFEISDSFVKNFGLGVPQNSTRTTVQNSQNHGANGFWNLWLHPADKHSLRIKGQNNRLGYYGFPVQAPAYWHDLQWSSFEKNDKYGTRYTGVELNGVVRRIEGGYFHQKLVRPIDNITLLTQLINPQTRQQVLDPKSNAAQTARPVCIAGLYLTPATATSDPCSSVIQSGLQTVVRPSALTFNKQVVVTNGADAQATLETVRHNNLIVGYQFWRDKSGDELNSAVYNTTPGTPGGTVPKFSPFAGYTLNTAIPVIAGKGTADSYNQENAFFLADNYDPTRWLRIALTYRFSHFTSKVFRAPDFPLAGGKAAIAGPAPAGIDLSGATPLAPVVNGTGDVTFTRNANTGSLALIGKPLNGVTVFGRVGNSLRIPALIETFFFRVFNQGTFAFVFYPNANIKPERGVNVDTGVKIARKYFRAGLTYYNNTYTNFIEQTAPILQAGGPGTVTDRINQELKTNFGFAFWVQRRNTGRARTQGLEGEFEVPFKLRNAGTLTLSNNFSAQHGQDLTPLYSQYCALDRQAQYNSYAGNQFFDFGTRSAGPGGANCPLTGTPASKYSDVPFERIVPFMTSTTLRYQEPKGRFFAELNARQRTRIHRLDPDLQENFLRFGYFTMRSLAGVTVYAARSGYSWYRENGRFSLNLALDNLSDKFYAEPFQYTAARGRSVTIGFTVESFNLLKVFK